MIKKTETKNSSSKIYRSEQNRILAGVAGGIGEYFTLDPVLIRIILVLIGLSGGGGIILYLVLWLIIPGQPENSASNNQENLKKNAQEIKDQTKKYLEDARGVFQKKEARVWLGFSLVFLGFYFILMNFGFLTRFLSFFQLWPLLLVGLGLALLFRS